MYHHAGSETVRGVVDNILIYPFAGADFTHYLPQFSALYFQVGWLQTFQNDRAYVGRYVTPGGIPVWSVGGSAYTTASISAAI